MEASGQLHAPAALPAGKDRGTHWIGDWLGSNTGLDSVRKETFLAESNLDSAVVQAVA